MSIQMPDGTEVRPEDIDPALFRALREPMFVYEDHPDTWGDHEVVVFNEDREYIVNIEAENCSCPALKYHHDADENCKHIMRAQLALGERDVPGWVNMEAVDDQLRRRLEEVVDRGDGIEADGGQPVVTTDELDPDVDTETTPVYAHCDASVEGGPLIFCTFGVGYAVIEELDAAGVYSPLEWVEGEVRKEFDDRSGVRLSQILPSEAERDGDPVRVGTLHYSDGRVFGLELDAEELKDRVFADGGVILPAEGDRVQDRDDDDPIPMRVLAVHRSRAKDVEIDDDQTVADVNPDYPDDARVVKCVFEGHLDRMVPEWDDWPADELNQRLYEYGEEWGVWVPTYHYPVPRLEEIS